MNRHSSVFRAPRAASAVALLVTVLGPAPSHAAGIDNTKVRTAETPFGDLLADALRKAAGADLAFLNAGAVRAGTTADSKPETLLRLVVYPTEKVGLLSLTGAQVKRALEHSLAALPTPSNGFLQVAGIKVTFDPAAPKGSRIRSVTLTGTGKPVDSFATYRVAVPLGLAKGGQGYFLVFRKAALKRTLEVTVGDALDAYLATLKRIPGTPAGRLTPTGR